MGLGTFGGARTGVQGAEGQQGVHRNQHGYLTVHDRHVGLPLEVGGSGLQHAVPPELCDEQVQGGRSRTPRHTECDVLRVGRKLNTTRKQRATAT